MTHIVELTKFQAYGYSAPYRICNLSSPSHLKPSVQRRALAYGQFLLSALGVSLAVHLALRDVWFAGLLLLGVSAVAIPQLRARRQMRALLASGDIRKILEVWSDTVEQLPNYRTTAPLARATALAAHGLVQRAGQLLERAERGEAWDRALEHRLFIEILIDTFEGRLDSADPLAQQLIRLPLPASLWARSRATTLRHGAAALVRAFNHQSQPGDGKRLAAAAQHHPLVHWAMQYAQAVLSIDQGKPDRALQLLSNAPSWPHDSVFSAFQQELVAVASDRLPK